MDLHIQQSKAKIRYLLFSYQKIDFNTVDPLKTRLLVILFFLISLFWGNSNNVTEKNIFKMFQITFHGETVCFRKF